MRIDENSFRHVLGDLIAENTLACRGVLGLSRVEFTNSVETLAVTLTTPATLKVNLGFVAEHCASEDDVKAVLLHEFLHVLLRHTGKFKSLTPLLNIALDAIINATIHRIAGPRLSGFFSRYYDEAAGLIQLLHPPPDSKPIEPRLQRLREQVYAGRVLADDLYDLIRRMAFVELRALLPDGRCLLGNHADDASDDECSHLPPEVLRGLESVGHILGRTGSGSPLQALGINCERRARNEKWHAVARRVFDRFKDPSSRSRRILRPRPASFLPVMHPGDRRAMLQSLWSPLLPQAAWHLDSPRPDAVINLYLDVSGSMGEHFAALVELLRRHSRRLRRPFWAFSDTVRPARIRNDRLETETSGGTRITPVIEHFLDSKARRAVIITDGYCERIPGQLIRHLGRDRIAALLLPNGTPDYLEPAGIPCFSLPDA